MEDEQQAVTEPVEQTTTEAAPAPEIESQESTEPAESDDAVEQAAEAITENRHTPRAERRIRELARKNRELEQQQTQPQPSPYNMPNYMPPRLPQYEPGAEVSPEQLQRDVAQAADGIAQLRVQQALSQYDQHIQSQQRAQQFDADVTFVEGKFQELNPDSDKYNPRLSSKITNLYEKAAANNPKLRLSEFVAEAMELAGAGADQTRSEVKSTLTKQAAQGAITPSNTRGPAEPDVSNMTPGQRAKYLEKKFGYAK